LLVLRPRERVACITKLFACGFAVELPIDFDAGAVRPAIPRAAFPAERRPIGDSSLAEALPGKQADLDFRLVEPASVFGRVVHGEAVPESAAALLAVEAGQGLAAVDVEIIHHPVDGLRFRVVLGHSADGLGEFSRGAASGGKSKMLSRLGFHRAENIGRAATLVLVVTPRLSSWLHRLGRAHLSMQCHRLLLQADHGFLGIVGFLLRLQDIFHPGDVLRIQFRHAPHFSPATA